MHDWILAANLKVQIPAVFQVGMTFPDILFFVLSHKCRYTTLQNRSQQYNAMNTREGS